MIGRSHHVSCDRATAMLWLVVEPPPSQPASASVNRSASAPPHDSIAAPLRLPAPRVPVCFTIRSLPPATASGSPSIRAGRLLRAHAHQYNARTWPVETVVAHASANVLLASDTCIRPIGYYM